MTDSRQRPELGILLFVANRALEQRVFDAIVAAGVTDITLAQARIAARIAPDGSRVSDLAEQARVTKQSAASLVEQLEKAQYVERVPDPTDGRARLVRLTPRLQRVARVADAEVARVLAEWADHVGADRLHQLHEILRDLRAITDPWWHS
ncbi:MarR family winged helix-turn-helix transcriptional regulator [Nocardioides mesophilus]|uniref:MarR family transcriptional regulator n=1 Tax=Nocardioides mesophilus TaxID=433659 RepID=A0A7G9RAN5_9ACTN|nr:MarR family transcriptional regulator [Nocardioides mesophilus]QNN52660.1 MarR family transcriptional regulator [Nocardioides mesophilus]